MYMLSSMKHRLKKNLKLLRVTNVHVIIHETSTQEEFEVIRFVENNTPFPLLLGTTWIEKD
jgi:hypothetical protein